MNIIILVGKICILDIDVQGVKAVKKTQPTSVPKKPNAARPFDCHGKEEHSARGGEAKNRISRHGDKESTYSDTVLPSMVRAFESIGSRAEESVE